MMPPEVQIIASMIKHLDARSIVEIGVQEGSLAKALLEEFESIENYLGVDVLFGAPLPLKRQANQTPRQAGILVSDNRFSTFTSRLGSLDPALAKLLQTMPADFFVIDGDHSENAVRSDTFLAKSVLRRSADRPKGIVWHDYGRIPEVTAALEWEQWNGIVHVLGTTLCFESF